MNNAKDLLKKLRKALQTARELSNELATAGCYDLMEDSAKELQTLRPNVEVCIDNVNTIFREEGIKG